MLHVLALLRQHMTQDQGYSVVHSDKSKLKKYKKENDSVIMHVNAQFNCFI